MMRNLLKRLALSVSKSGKTQGSSADTGLSQASHRISKHCEDRQHILQMAHQWSALFGSVLCQQNSSILEGTLGQQRG